MTLLRELCETVPMPRHVSGRPKLPISDVLYALALKVYTGMSGRRSMTDVRAALKMGLLGDLPSSGSAFKYMKEPSTAPLVRTLIQRSALPLRAVERHFSVDSSGFSSTVYDRWYDKKYGRERKETKWVKSHIICGVKTNIIPDAWVTETGSSDTLYLKPLVETTALNFDVQAVSADKAYLSRENLHVIEDLGAAAYIPFKSNSVAHNPHRKFDALWAKLYHYYHLKRDEFSKHYHKRSNVEATYHMVKSKFGGYVRSKTPPAQVNEVLFKILCHNICVIIQSAYELGGGDLLVSTPPDDDEASQLAWDLGRVA